MDRDNLNKAYKRVKANKGAAGVDGMTVEEALAWLKEHGKELTESIRSGKLLANVYLNEFDHEYESRGVPVIRYADDIVLLCKSERAAGRLLESSIRYLEGKLKLKVNREKSHIAKWKNGTVGCGEESECTSGNNGRSRKPN